MPRSLWFKYKSNATVKYLGQRALHPATCWLHVMTVLGRSCDPMPACDGIPKWEEALTHRIRLMMRT